MTRFPKLLVILAVVVLVGAVGGILVWSAHLEASASAHHPSDSRMIRDFQKHREQHAELLQLCQAHEEFDPRYDELRKGVLSNDPGLPDAEDPVFKRYSDLREQLGVRGVRIEPDRAYIYTSTYGWALSGSAKGYVYSGAPLAPLVEDTQKDALGGYGEIYHLIEGSWYLFYSWDD